MSDEQDYMDADSHLGRTGQPLPEFQDMKPAPSNEAREEWPEHAAICKNCGTIQHDQLDEICMTCHMRELEPIRKRVVEEHNKALAERDAEIARLTEQNAFLNRVCEQRIAAVHRLNEQLAAARERNTLLEDVVKKYDKAINQLPNEMKPMFVHLMHDEKTEKQKNT